MEYTIGKFASVTGTSIDTLRYYEKEELIVPQRLNNGWRCYSDADIAWIQFIKRLKATGMPIRGIQEYAGLRALGDDTLEERMELLVTHRSVLKNEIASMLQNLDALNDKIGYYQSEIENNGGAPGARAAELANHTSI